jgi:Carbohydrate binding domain/PEP-CTERM motif
MKMLNKIIGGSIAIAAVLAFSASTTQAATLVNGGFETALPQTANPITLAGVDQGWTTFNGAGSAAQSSVVAQSGTYSLLETAGVGNNWNPAGAYQIVSGITAGQSYTFSIWALTDTVNDTYGNNTAGVLFQLGFGNFTNPTNSQQFVSLGSSVSPDPHLPTINTWTLYTATGVAPAGATDASVYAMFQDNGSATATEHLYYDNASLTVTPVPEPSSLVLLAMGLGLPFYFWRRRNS